VADQSSILTLKSWESQGVFSFTCIRICPCEPVALSMLWLSRHRYGYLAAAFFGARPFFRAGSGSIKIRCPFNSLLFNKLIATATSDSLSISTKPKPRQRPDALSLTASARITPPVSREVLVECAARYGAGKIANINPGHLDLLRSSNSNCPSGRPKVAQEGLIQRRIGLILFGTAILG